MKVLIVVHQQPIVRFRSLLFLHELAKLHIDRNPLGTGAVVLEALNERPGWGISPDYSFYTSSSTP
jgi:hypothetical protein